MEMGDRIEVLNARLQVLHELLDMLRLQGQAQHSDFLEVIIILLICVGKLGACIGGESACCLVLHCGLLHCGLLRCLVSRCCCPALRSLPSPPCCSARLLPLPLQTLSSC
jgi:hypothetical protein